MPVFGKAVISGSPKPPFANFDALLIYTLKVSPKRIKNVCSTRLDVLRQILLGEEPGPVFRGSPSPGNGYLRRICGLPLLRWLFPCFPNPWLPLFHLVPIPCRSPRVNQPPNTGDRPKLSWGLSDREFFATALSTYRVSHSG